VLQCRLLGAEAAVARIFSGKAFRHHSLQGLRSRNRDPASAPPDDPATTFPHVLDTPQRWTIQWVLEEAGNPVGDCRHIHDGAAVIEFHGEPPPAGLLRLLAVTSDNKVLGEDGGGAVLVVVEARVVAEPLLDLEDMPHHLVEAVKVAAVFIPPLVGGECSRGGPLIRLLIEDMIARVFRRQWFGLPHWRLPRQRGPAAPAGCGRDPLCFRPHLRGGPSGVAMEHLRCAPLSGP